ncbi:MULTISPECIES: D-alanyl-D-alanine carboxypeptidase/D-alanyl-D-alanine endopeptidase [unclassified Streptomyces]|uniref:D-alanyl-D-alanine carboxypeptidase/D-alanyl-D-alanine endopeptidase n=1 Tax=unclassified Streptomyces TaxID=2593676 RepID=UPI002E281651|nr:D-alanyl-D-alanine carboxypeptidase/D-alanyl-D-alanine-endopeptidase [Streptomyces sp. NBC_00223]
MPLGRTWQLVAGSAATGLLVAAGAVAAAGPWESGQRTAERSRAGAYDRATTVSARSAVSGPVLPPAPTAAPVLLPAGTDAPPARALASRLDPLMSAAGLGSIRTGAVIDVATGKSLYDHRGGAATTPASTTKLATAVAALGMLGPDHRLTTSVVATAEDRIVLVGGGDPTLDLGQLADDTAAALTARGTTAVRLSYDTSLYSGSSQHPIGWNENLASVTALMVDEGRLDHSTAGPAQRSYDPAAAAASAFAGLLRDRGVTVEDWPRPGSGKGGTRLAVHRSAPLSELVERMLTNSDNDLAEALARHVALAAGEPGSFAGAAKAIPEALRKYGVPLSGAVFRDGSGLDHDDRLAPVTLARILALAAAPDHAELRPVLTGMPVAGFSGTLAERFRAAPGAGVVRAKTGTLTGTNTIAGIVVAPSGRLLAFSFMTQETSDPAAAEAALDRLAAALTKP